MKILISTFRSSESLTITDDSSSINYDEKSLGSMIVETFGINGNEDEIIIHYCEYGMDNDDESKQGYHEKNGGDLAENDLNGFQIVVLVDYPRHDVIRLNEYCCLKEIGFIYCFVYGLVGGIFVDFGSLLKKNDEDGEIEEECSRSIANITKEGVVAIESVGSFCFETGDVVRLSAMNKEMNGKTYKVTKCWPTKYELELNTNFASGKREEAFSSYRKGTGVIDKLKKKSDMDKWISFRDTSIRPHKEIHKASIWPKQENLVGARSCQLFLGVEGIWSFQQMYSKLPDEKTILEVKSFCDKYLELNLEVNKTAPGTAIICKNIDDKLLSIIASYAQYQHPLVKKKVANITKDLLSLKNLTCFQGGNQILLFDVSRALENNLITWQELINDDDIEESIKNILDHVVLE